MVRSFLPGALCIVLVAAGASGCSSKPKTPIVLQACEYDLFDPPQLVDRGITSATFNFPFKVTNPNPVPVALDRMDFEPTINGGRMGRNQCTPQVVISPSQSRKVDVEYQLSYISAGMGVVDAIVKKEATIIVEGTATISNASDAHVADPLDHPINIR